MIKRDVNLIVTDHAILRWLEREHGVDIAAVRKHLQIKAMTGAQLGAIAVQVGKVKLVLREIEIIDGVAQVAVPSALPKGNRIRVK